MSEIGSCEVREMAPTHKVSFIKYNHLHIDCLRVVNVDSSQRQACKWRKCLKMGGSGIPCTRLKCKLCGQQFDDLKCLSSHRRECNSNKEVKEM